MSVIETSILPIALIVPTRNRTGPLTRMLASSQAQGGFPAEIIVVDGSDDDATRQLAVSFAQKVGSQGCTVTYKRAEELGAAAQRNQGVALAAQPIIGFCDDDILFEAACLERLWGALDKDKQLGGANAMITNQQYHPPGTASRIMFRLMAGSSNVSYAGRVLGPAVNLLPEDCDDLPDVVPVEWLNTTCTLYRREALPSPVFAQRFRGYSLMEDLALSLSVGRTWKLANVRSARILHDTQPGQHKEDIVVLSRMELVNRHYVMTEILARRDPMDYARLAAWELFQLGVCAVQRRDGAPFWRTLHGKLLGVGDILTLGLDQDRA